MTKLSDDMIDALLLNDPAYTAALVERAKLLPPAPLVLTPQLLDKLAWGALGKAPNVGHEITVTWYEEAGAVLPTLKHRLGKSVWLRKRATGWHIPRPSRGWRKHERRRKQRERRI